MAFNGSGIFQRLYNWASDAANSINITAYRMDAETDGIAAGLSNCITRDGQGKPLASIDWNTQNLTNVNAIAAASAAFSANVSAGALFGSDVQAFKVINSIGVLAGYNTANSIRTGYLQFAAGGAVVLYADPASSTGVVLNTNGGSVVLSQAGNVVCTGNIAAANLLSGSYTPTLFNSVNISSSSAHVCYYVKVGTQVIVYGTVNIDPTSASSFTELGISLPIPSTLSLANQLAGTGSTFTSASPGCYTGQILGDTSNARASLGFTTITDVLNNNWSFSFSYPIL